MWRIINEKQAEKRNIMAAAAKKIEALAQAAIKHQRHGENGGVKNNRVAA